MTDHNGRLKATRRSTVSLKAETVPCSGAMDVSVILDFAEQLRKLVEIGLPENSSVHLAPNAASKLSVRWQNVEDEEDLLKPRAGIPAAPVRVKKRTDAAKSILEHDASVAQTAKAKEKDDA